MIAKVSSRHLQREQKTRPAAVRTLIVYPLNGFVQDQLVRLRGAPITSSPAVAPIPPLNATLRKRPCKCASPTAGEPPGTRRRPVARVCSWALPATSLDLDCMRCTLCTRGRHSDMQCN
jgi:hypothetical protein